MTLMRPAVVVVFNALTQNLTKVIFTKNEDVIQAFSTIEPMDLSMKALTLGARKGVRNN